MVVSSQWIIVCLLRDSSPLSPRHETRRQSGIAQHQVVLIIIIIIIIVLVIITYKLAITKEPIIWMTSLANVT